MSIFVVDQEKCKRDGICATVCPVSIIAMNSHGPEPVEGVEERCLNCGHCVAVCPHGAFSLQTMPVGQCPSLQENWKLTPDQVEQFLKGRRSDAAQRPGLQYRLQQIGCVHRAARSRAGTDQAATRGHGRRDRPVRTAQAESHRRDQHVEDDYSEHKQRGPHHQTSLSQVR